MTSSDATSRETPDATLPFTPFAYDAQQIEVPGVVAVALRDLLLAGRKSGPEAPAHMPEILHGWMAICQMRGMTQSPSAWEADTVHLARQVWARLHPGEDPPMGVPAVPVSRLLLRYLHALTDFTSGNSIGPNATPRMQAASLAAGDGLRLLIDAGGDTASGSANKTYLTLENQRLAATDIESHLLREIGQHITPAPFRTGHWDETAAAVAGRTDASGADDMPTRPGSGGRPSSHIRGRATGR